MLTQVSLVGGNPREEVAHVKDVVNVGHELIVKVAGQVLIDRRHEDDVGLGELQTNVKENTLCQVGVCLVE